MTVFLKQNEAGSFIGTNTHFSDSSKGDLTFVHPSKSSNALSMKVEEALKTIPALKAYWLHQLNIEILSEK